MAAKKKASKKTTASRARKTSDSSTPKGSAKGKNRAVELLSALTVRSDPNFGQFVVITPQVRDALVEALGGDATATSSHGNADADGNDTDRNADTPPTPSTVEPNPSGGTTTPNPSRPH